MLLIEHPAPFAAAELERELTVRQSAAHAPGAVREAIDALVGVGLADRNGKFVLPSRAAVYFDRLAID